MENNIENDIITFDRQTYTNTFRIDIEDVWSFLKDTSRTYEALKGIRSDAKFTKGTKSYEVASEFNFIFFKYRRIFFKVMEVVDESMYKKLVFKVRNEPTDQDYLFIYNLYKVSLDHSTYLKWEFLYKDPIKMKKIQYDKIRTEREEMLKLFEVHLNSIFPIYTQTESILLKCKLRYLMKVIANWKTFHTLVPELGEEFYLENADEEYLTVGQEFMAVFEKKAKPVILRVSKSENIGLQYFYNLQLFEELDSPPSQELRFQLTYVDEKKTFLEYSTIILKENQDIDKLTEYKQKVLLRLKASLKKLLSRKSKKVVSN